MHTSHLQGPLYALMVTGSLAASIGCGGVSRGVPPDAVADSSTGTPPDAPPPDAAPTARCDPTKPFGTPTPITEINRVQPRRDPGGGGGRLGISIACAIAVA